MNKMVVLVLTIFLSGCLSPKEIDANKAIRQHVCESIDSELISTGIDWENGVIATYHFVCMDSNKKTRSFKFSYNTNTKTHSEIQETFYE